MKFIVSYYAKDVNGKDFNLTESFPTKNKYTGLDAYVWKKDLLNNIKKAHKDFVEVSIKECSIRVWNGENCEGTE
jgi:hypothetical protein